MTIRAVARFELWNKLACLSGARLATGGFVEPSSAQTIKSTEGTESITLTMPRTADAAIVVRESYILRKWRSDSVIEEWPIGPISMTRGKEGVTTIVARALIYRLGELGLVTQPGVDPINGLPILEFSVTGTPTALIGSYLTARSPSDDLSTQLALLGIGTIEPTADISVDVSWWSPLQFLRGIIDALEQIDVLASLSIRRNGTTNYLVDILNDPVTT